MTICPFFNSLRSQRNRLQVFGFDFQNRHVQPGSAARTVALGASSESNEIVAGLDVPQHVIRREDGPLVTTTPVPNPWRHKIRPQNVSCTAWIGNERHRSPQRFARFLVSILPQPTDGDDGLSVLAMASMTVASMAAAAWRRRAQRAGRLAKDRYAAGEGSSPGGGGGDGKRATERRGRWA